VGESEGMAASNGVHEPGKLLQLDRLVWPLTFACRELLSA
jgi:hypothetical protein